HDLPWHRVLRTDGTPAAHLAREQLERLRAEGVLADGECVPMRRYRWEACVRETPAEEAGAKRSAVQEIGVEQQLFE
ncbi:MAG: hypothetical protein ACRDQ5_00845, partial [Sciscionella sp.]